MKKRKPGAPLSDVDAQMERRSVHVKPRWHDGTENEYLGLELPIECLHVYHEMRKLATTRGKVP